jgi:hypothetical protein
MSLTLAGLPVLRSIRGRVLKKKRELFLSKFLKWGISKDVIKKPMKPKTKN